MNQPESSSISVTYKHKNTIFFEKNFSMFDSTEANMHHLDDVPFLEAELVCLCCGEGEESHGLHPEESLETVSVHE